MKEEVDILNVLIGDSQPVFIELITELVREVVGEKCNLRIHYTDRADELIDLANVHQVDLFVLFLNNILFPASNVQSENRMKKVMRLVWNLKMECERPIIGVCGLPEYEDYSKIAGVDVFFAAPFKNEIFVDAVRTALLEPI
ncbi:MAG: hypothetical protein ACTSWQ_05785 [Candidatus Thorarchaeota archaeon]